MVAIRALTADLIVRNLTYTNNYSDYTGGVHIYAKSSTFDNLVFNDNSASTESAALHLIITAADIKEAKITNAEFSNNSAVTGSALTISSNAESGTGCKI